MTITDAATPDSAQFSNPATGESIQFTATAQDGGEDVVRFNWRSMPGGAITEHVHPHQEERFIDQPQARPTSPSTARNASSGPGETIVVPIGVRHSESNPGSVAIEAWSSFARRLEPRRCSRHSPVSRPEGKTTPRGAPKNPLQLGATVWHFRHESRATSPPIWVQNLILPPLAALAKVFGVRPYHDRWDSRTATASEPTP